MDLDRAQGLAFLLSLAALPMAGCPASTEDTTSGGTGDTTGDSQTSDPSTDPSTVSITSTDPTDVSASMSTTVDPTTDPSTLTDPTDTTPTTEGPTTDPTDATTSAEDTTTDPSTDEGTTGPIDPVCTEFVDHVIECFPKYAGAEDDLNGYCNDTLQYYAAYSPECGTAAEELFACLALADCGDLEAETACPEETEALATVCGDLGSTSSTGGN